MSGVLPVWKARRIAEQTIPLDAAAAGFVDAQLEAFAHRISITRIIRCVDAAIIRFHPDLASRNAEAAAEMRGVWLEDDSSDGTTRITAVADSPDAHALDRALDEHAMALGALGDGSSRQARRARALGVLADPQHALDLQTAATSPSVDAPAKVTRSAASPVLHLPLHAACRCGATSGSAAEGVFGPVARVSTEGLHSWRSGPVPAAAVERWLDGLSPGTQVRVTPVVDMSEHLAVDAYEHPVALQRQVAERDLVWSFPWCGRAGAADLDHIEPYRGPDDGGGPPGQTSTANTARLCRHVAECAKAERGQSGALGARFGHTAFVERQRVRLVAATVPLLQALNDDRSRFGELIGSPVPDGWPEFPEAVAFTLEHLQNATERDHSWSMQFFLAHATGRLLGSGGFAAPPNDRTIEIGYEVAPEFRGMGFGAAAARALVELAVASGEVDHVVAHTLPGPNASTGVLVSLDFQHVADQEDPEVGEVWEWRWTRPPLG